MDADPGSNPIMCKAFHQGKDREGLADQYRRLYHKGTKLEARSVPALVKLSAGLNRVACSVPCVSSGGDNVASERRSSVFSASNDSVRSVSSQRSVIEVFTQDTVKLSTSDDPLVCGFQRSHFLLPGAFLPSL